MSLYNLLNGCTPATFFIMPMLGDKHPEEYPRFRDCFTSDEEHPEYDGFIHVYTRVGGNNRGDGFGEEELYQHPNFVATFDDSFDNTFATYVFSVPNRWKEDFERMKSEGPVAVSEDYQRQCRKVFPKLREMFNTLWPATHEDEPELVNAVTPSAAC